MQECEKGRERTTFHQQYAKDSRKPCHSYLYYPSLSLILQHYITAFYEISYLCGFTDIPLSGITSLFPLGYILPTALQFHLCYDLLQETSLI